MASDEIWCVRAGLIAYTDALALQKRLERARQSEEIPDVLLLLEHPPVYTRGRRTTKDELPMGEEWYRAQGIEVGDDEPRLEVLCRIVHLMRDRAGAKHLSERVHHPVAQHRPPARIRPVLFLDLAAAHLTGLQSGAHRWSPRRRRSGP